MTLLFISLSLTCFPDREKESGKKERAYIATVWCCWFVLCICPWWSECGIRHLGKGENLRRKLVVLYRMIKSQIWQYMYIFLRHLKFAYFTLHFAKKCKRLTHIWQPWREWGNEGSQHSQDGHFGNWMDGPQQSNAFAQQTKLLKLLETVHCLNNCLISPQKIDSSFNSILWLNCHDLFSRDWYISGAKSLCTHT
jgi:hypothetical protein